LSPSFILLFVSYSVSPLESPVYVAVPVGVLFALRAALSSSGAGRDFESGLSHSGRHSPHVCRQWDLLYLFAILLPPSKK
jgi:hypothetical protein